MKTILERESRGEGKRREEQRTYSDFRLKKFELDLYDSRTRKLELNLKSKIQHVSDGTRRARARHRAMKLKDQSRSKVRLNLQEIL